MKKHLLPFKFSPNLITLLGEQLIHDKKIALSELVKNAYDADASFVEIRINENEIVISDDGFGMDIDVIKNVWLQPGISHKKTGVANKEPTPKYKRLPIGEKGVGRLGAHKLGSQIELYSKSIDALPVHFSIDWNKIERADSFENLEAIVVEELEQKPSQIEHETGTSIIIGDLKEQWEDNDTESCIKDLLHIISPFSSKNNFDIRVFRNGTLFALDIKDKVQQIKDKSLYQFRVVIECGHLTEFNYSFTPWESINKVPSRHITLQKNAAFIQQLLESKKIQSTISLERKQENSDGIGTICFEGFIYDFDNELLKREFTPHQKKFTKEYIKHVKEYMKQSGGIRVYRDGMRIYNYGDKGFDIVDLDLKRVNRPAGKISSNQIAAMVQLKRAESTELIEKTNREGFIHNTAFNRLVVYLDAAIDIISELRQNDKAKIIAIYLTKFSKADIAQRHIKLNDIIERSQLTDGEKRHISKELIQFVNEVNHLKDVLLTASNTGINMSIIIHEIDKIIDHLERSIQKQDVDLIQNVFNHLKHMVDIYKKTIRLDKKKPPILVSELIEQVIFNADYRFESHGIKFDTDIEKNLTIVGQQGLIIGIFTNLFDNAIYWLKAYEIQDKHIMVKAYHKDDYVYFIIADNGKGFTLDFDVALVAFTSGRKEETSMGIGLFLAEQIMIAHEGTITHGNWKDERLPQRFAHGAIIKLKFKKG